MSGRSIGVAVVQAELGNSDGSNVPKMEGLIREAAAAGASVVVLPELFEGPYFPKTKDEAHRELARQASGHPMLSAMAVLARECSVVLPLSFFEQHASGRFNTVATVDADGSCLGFYRKSHIPEGAGYEEAYYFAPGDKPPVAWATRFGRVGVSICWDQWYPECARLMALDGAELIIYPSAIGSEPGRPDLYTKDPWQRVMAGHAVANSVPVAAANRIGCEDGQTFYGHSFICDHRGRIVAELGADEEGVALAEIDLDEAADYRQWFGLLRGRRPELYSDLSRTNETSGKV